MTAGERLLWLATYAATWTADSERQRKYADADVESGKVARAVRAASEATRAVREACARGTVPDLELVREVLGDDPAKIAFLHHMSKGAPAPQTPAERELEVQAGGTPQPGRYLVQDAHNLHRAASEITASSTAAAARIYAESGRAQDVPDEYVVTDHDGRVFDVRLDIDFEALEVREAEPARQLGSPAARPLSRSAAQQPDSSAALATSTPAVPIPSRRGLERVRRVNGRRRRAAAAKGAR